MDKEAILKELLLAEDPWQISRTTDGRWLATRGEQAVTASDIGGLKVSVETATHWTKNSLEAQVEWGNVKQHLDRLFKLIAGSTRIRSVLGAKDGEHFLIPVIEYFEAIDRHLIRRNVGIDIDDGDEDFEDWE